MKNATHTDYDIIIIGAGAAGLMCGGVAGARGRRVLILDHAKAAGEKIRISGGGRCNFTNKYSRPENFLSQNPHFCKSALSQYTPQDFITMVEHYNIAYHEKTNESATHKDAPNVQLGQLFCDGRSQEIILMLLEECRKGGNEIKLNTEILDIKKSGDVFSVTTNQKSFTAHSVIIACGGPSIPKMGATSYGYKIAEQFGLNIIEPRPALVPLTFTDSLIAPLRDLAGLAVPAQVSHGKTAFNEALLFTHRGLSGPSILQISSYWKPGETITINLAPGTDIESDLKTARQNTPRLSPAQFLSKYLPQRLAGYIAQTRPHPHLAEMSDKVITALADSLTDWTVKPAGTEGYRKAEVTLGGVDTAGLSSKTMETKSVPGLYFIGEVVDVTGHLGGHNFQWAWASGFAAGQNA